MLQIRFAPGADVIQIFDSWVGCLSVEDYRRYVLPHAQSSSEATAENRRAQLFISAPIVRRCCPSMNETGADVIGLDWRIPLDEGWAR